MKRNVSSARDMKLLCQTAEEASAGDPVLAEILLMNLQYNWGKGNQPFTPHIDEPTVVDGVKYWCVGHNASHEFEVGTDGNGRRFVRSVGESVTVDVDGDPLVMGDDGWFTKTPGLDIHVSEVTTFGGYLGHF